MEKIIQLSRGKAKEELRNFFNRSIAEVWIATMKHSGVSSESIIQRMMSNGETKIHDSMMERLEADFNTALDDCLSEYKREQQ
jgi:hypothetical protein